MELTLDIMPKGAGKPGVKTNDKQKMNKDERARIALGKIAASSQKLKKLKTSPNVYDAVEKRFGEIHAAADRGENIFFGDIFPKMTVQELRTLLKFFHETKNNVEPRLKMMKKLLIGEDTYDMLRSAIEDLRGLEEDEDNLLNFAIERSPFVNKNGSTSWDTLYNMLDALIDRKLDAGVTTVGSTIFSS
jgi:hypothetical protein